MDEALKVAVGSAPRGVSHVEGGVPRLEDCPSQPQGMQTPGQPKAASDLLTGLGMFEIDNLQLTFVECQLSSRKF